MENIFICLHVNILVRKNNNYVLFNNPQTEFMSITSSDDSFVSKNPFAPLSEDFKIVPINNKKRLKNQRMPREWRIRNHLETDGSFKVCNGCTCDCRCHACCQICACLANEYCICEELEVYESYAHINEP